MALSMLGYRCCSDFDGIPECELERLAAGVAQPVFNAYVNIGSLMPHLRTLRLRYPHAKFIVTEDEEAADSCSDDVLEALKGAVAVRLQRNDANGQQWDGDDHERRRDSLSAHPGLRGTRSATNTGRRCVVPVSMPIGSTIGTPQNACQIRWGARGLHLPHRGKPIPQADSNPCH